MEVEGSFIIHMIIKVYVLFIGVLYCSILVHDSNRSHMRKLYEFNMFPSLIKFRLNGFECKKSLMAFIIVYVEKQLSINDIV